MYNFRNYIFDLDGTLIDSSNDVIKCLKTAFIQSECFVNEEKFNKNLIGPPLQTIVKNIIPDVNDENLIEGIIKNFRQIYDTEEDDISLLYDDIEKLLFELKQANKKLYIATFKPLKPTLRILDKFNISNYFDDVYCIDKLKKTMNKCEMILDIIDKYELKKEETVMIGDSKSDMIAAKEVQITGIGVLWGYDADKSSLIQNADFIINAAEELLIKN